jgi:hypothetical protein
MTGHHRRKGLSPQQHYARPNMLGAGEAVDHGRFAALVGYEPPDEAQGLGEETASDRRRERRRPSTSRSPLPDRCSRPRALPGRSCARSYQDEPPGRRPASASDRHRWPETPPPARCVPGDRGALLEMDSEGAAPPKDHLLHEHQSFGRLDGDRAGMGGKWRPEYGATYRVPELWRRCGTQVAGGRLIGSVPAMAIANSARWRQCFGRRQAASEA